MEGVKVWEKCGKCIYLHGELGSEHKDCYLKNNCPAPKVHARLKELIDERHSLCASLDQVEQEIDHFKERYQIF